MWPIYISVPSHCSKSRSNKICCLNMQTRGSVIFFSSNCECLSATKTSSGVCGHNPMWHGQSRGRDWRARRKRQRMATLNESKREVERQTEKESEIFPVPFSSQEHTRVKLMLPFLFPIESPIKRCNQMKATDQNSLNWLSSFEPLWSHHLNFQRQLAEH